MATDNPFSRDYVPPPDAAPAPPAPVTDNPFNRMPDPVGPGGSEVVAPGDKPYAPYSTAGRMVTDAIFGLPDTANMLARGLNTGVDAAIQAVTGQTPPPATNPIPYVAPIARQAMGVSELPEDASMGRILAEAGGSALMGGALPAVGRGVVRGIRALPEAVSALNPFGTVKGLTEDALRSSGSQRYGDLANLDVRLKETVPPQMADAIEYKFQQPGSRIPDYHAPNTYQDVNQLRNIDQTQRLPSGAIVNNDYATTNDVLGVRDLLNQTRASNPLNPRERKAANIAIGGIDNFLENIPPSALHPTSLNDPRLVGQLAGDARSDWAASERLGYLNRTEQGADFRAGAKAPGSINAAQAVRDRIASNLAADAQGRGPLYGFSPNEKQALEDVSTGSPLNRFGRFIGRAAPTSALGLALQTGSLGAGGLGYYAGLDPTTAGAIAFGIPAVGFAGKVLSNAGTRMAMRQARDLIASRSALGGELGIPTPSWDAIPKAPLVSRNDIAAAMAASGGGARQPTKIYIHKYD